MKQELEKPGFIDFKILNNKPQLDDLWFFTGSRCNLSCKHCYVASSPTNNRLEIISLEDVTPFVEEAKEYGLQNIYFTGGEPFINKHMMKILEYCLGHAHVTVLTNATLPIEQFIEKLKELNEKSPFNLQLRVSLDHYDPKKHDAIRGEGNFNRTVTNVLRLSDAGFDPIITVSAVVYEDNTLSQSQIREKFKAIFLGMGVKVDVKLLPMLEMGTNLKRLKQISKYIHITEEAMKTMQPEQFQCHNGRTIEKIDGQMRVYPCPIIYDNPKFELATNLKDSFKKVFLTHKACYDFCYKAQGSCTN